MNTTLTKAQQAPSENTFKFDGSRFVFGSAPRVMSEFSFHYHLPPVAPPSETSKEAGSPDSLPEHRAQGPRGGGLRVWTVYVKKGEFAMSDGP